MNLPREDARRGQPGHLLNMFPATRSEAGGLLLDNPGTQRYLRRVRGGSERVAGTKEAKVYRGGSGVRSRRGGQVGLSEG